MELTVKRNFAETLNCYCDDSSTNISVNSEIYIRNSNANLPILLQFVSLCGLSADPLTCKISRIIQIRLNNISNYHPFLDTFSQHSIIN